jgi:nucleoside phosphorylase
MRVALGTALRSESIGVADPSRPLGPVERRDDDAVVEFATGVGLNAAMRGVTSVIGDCHPDALVFFGSAGSVDAACGVGYAIVCTAVSGTIGAQTITLAADRALAAHSARCLSSHAALRTGMAFSSPTFVSSQHDRAAVARRGAVCVETEGLAVAIACTWARVPWIMIRVITDDADSPPGFPSAELIAEHVRAVRPAIAAFIRQLQSVPAGARS